MRKDLPRSVFLKSSRYYLVRAEGTKRIWIPLSRVKEGLPALYLALSQVEAEVKAYGTMPALIAEWQREVMPKHAKQTQATDIARCKIIAQAFVEFTPDQLTPPDCMKFLAQFRDRKRTFNAYRGQLRELMRYAEEVGQRQPGTNPIQSIKTVSIKKRTRYITDSELRRIKVAAMYGDDGKRTRSGPMLCALVDMAYLTGQRIGDLLKLEWKAINEEGIAFTQAKTDARVFVEWTPRLREVARRLREMRLAKATFSPRVFTTQDGRSYTYWGASTAWKRAVRRSGVEGVTFHDLRRKAGTDKDATEGMAQARVLLGHTTEHQTATYVSPKRARTTKATR